MWEGCELDWPSWPEGNTDGGMIYMRQSSTQGYTGYWESSGGGGRGCV